MPSRCRNYLMRELTVVKLCVESLLRQQSLMGAFFHDVSVPHDQDQIRFLDGRQPVGHF